MIDPNPLQPLSFRPKQPIPNGRAASKKQLDPNCVLDSFQTDTLTTPPEYSTEKLPTELVGGRWAVSEAVIPMHYI
jgi:hypothetical protein